MCNLVYLTLRNKIFLLFILAKYMLFFTFFLQQLSTLVLVQLSALIPLSLIFASTWELLSDYPTLIGLISL